MKKKFANSNLASCDEDPDEWIMELENLRTQIDAVSISGRMRDVDFIIHVLANLPQEYESTVENLEEKLENTENPLDLETVRTKPNSRFARITKQNEEDDDKNKAYAAFQRGNQYSEEKCDN